MPYTGQMSRNPVVQMVSQAVCYEMVPRGLHNLSPLFLTSHLSRGPYPQTGDPQTSPPSSKKGPNIHLPTIDPLASRASQLRFQSSLSTRGLVTFSTNTTNFHHNNTVSVQTTLVKPNYWRQFISGVRLSTIDHPHTLSSQTLPKHLTLCHIADCALNLITSGFVVHS